MGNTTTLYEVKSKIASIYNKASFASAIVGSLPKGAQIEVLRFTNQWACFIFNGNEAYIRKSYIKISTTIPTKTGSITIKYLNVDNNNEILSSDTYNNLQLGTYTYTAKNITNYNTNLPTSTSVTLDENNPNQTIIFYYSQILGNITIKYLDFDTNNEVATSNFYDNLTLKTYTYKAKEVSNYKINSPASQSITLDENNTSQTITFYYSQILGDVTVKYLDSNKNTEILTSDIHKNLQLGTYTYEAKPIKGYSINASTSQTVTLAENNYSQTITFLYEKILGKVTIQYINTDTNEKLLDTEIYENLELGNYSYKAKTIDNYSLSSEETINVTLTETNLDVSIVFEYKLNEVTEILDISKQNEVPYISTYYIKPIVKPTEEVIIDYYITDYYHKEYVNEDFSEVFKVIVRIEGKDDIVIKNLKAGDHSVSLGTFPNLDGQEQKFSILCTDKYGRNSHELFNFFLVRNDVIIKEYIMTNEDLKTYNISNANDTTMITNTREGLQKLLDDKKALGYNKLKLLEGTYRIDHLGTIYIPTNFTLDMNYATLKLHEFAGDKALMMELNNTFDSHVINGTIEGDMLNHDYTNSPNNSEWVHGISIGGESKYSSYENLTIKDITGYGTINGIKNSRDGKLAYTYLPPKSIGNMFKLGDVDRNTGLDIESTNRTSCDFMDISGYSNIGYLSVSVYLGYQGNPCGTWNLICHFYDENKNFIKSTDAYQYRRVGVPSNSKFMRVTILNESYPTNLSIQLFRLPTHCTFKDLYLENCRAVGMAPQGMNNLLFENCELTNCGSAVTKCALDAEDGWDMMQDVTFRKLHFHDNPYNEFLTCAGHNFIIEKMINGNIYTWSRTRNYVIRNSNICNAVLGYDSLFKTGYYRFYNNHSQGVTCKEKANTDNFIIRNSKLTTFTNATAYNCTITSGITTNAYAYACTFINFDSYINNNIIISDSNFIVTDNQSTNLKFNQAYGLKTFNNCTFSGPVILSGNYCNSGTFNNCTFDNINMTINYSNKIGDLNFINCEITYYEKKESIDSGFIKFTNNSSATFENCTIICVPNENNDKIALVWIRNYVSGSKTIFKNCNISKNNGYVIDGYYNASTFKTDTSYEVIFDNSPISIQLLSDKYMNYNYYTVTIIN